jgi:hypothetical protein
MRAKKPLSITHRISAVTNSFVQSILPRTSLSPEEERELRELLGQEASDHWICVYCGASATEWDHLYPLVVARRPSGHLNVFGNLVPACGPCNHSKGAKDWRDWLTGGAKGSPASRQIPDLDRRKAKLERYSAIGAKTIAVAELYDPTQYEQYWAKLHDIEMLMREAQVLANDLRGEAEAKLT